jgi:hypothetical protein
MDYEDLEDISTMDLVSELEDRNDFDDVIATRIKKKAPAELIDLIIENGDDDLFLDIVSEKNIIIENEMHLSNLNGDKLKRHLCDIVDLSYTATIKEIFKQLITKL